VEINGYRIFLNDTEVVASGTSAVAPLWGAFLGCATSAGPARLYQAPVDLDEVAGLTTSFTGAILPT
jgi:hypothetical protein